MCIFDSPSLPQSLSLCFFSPLFSRLPPLFLLPFYFCQVLCTFLFFHCFSKQWRPHVFHLHFHVHTLLTMLPMPTTFPFVSFNLPRTLFTLSCNYFYVLSPLSCNFMLSEGSNKADHTIDLHSTFDETFRSIVFHPETLFFFTLLRLIIKDPEY